MGRGILQMSTENASWSSWLLKRPPAFGAENPVVQHLISRDLRRFGVLNLGIEA